MSESVYTKSGINTWLILTIYERYVAVWKRKKFCVPSRKNNFQEQRNSSRLRTIFNAPHCFLLLRLHSAFPIAWFTASVFPFLVTNKYENMYTVASRIISKLRLRMWSDEGQKATAIAAANEINAICSSETFLLPVAVTNHDKMNFTIAFNSRSQVWRFCKFSFFFSA